jgi:uncharacterized protein with GYD domain
MSTFVALLRFPNLVTRTDGVVRVVKDIQPQLERIKHVISSTGVELKEFETTIGGSYDAVAILELHDDRLIDRVTEATRRLNAVWVEPLRAISDKELIEYVAAPHY